MFFLLSFSALKTEGEFLLNLYPFFRRFMISASCYPLKISILRNFLSIWRFRVVFISRSSEGHHFRRFLRSQLSTFVHKFFSIVVSSFISQLFWCFIEDFFKFVLYISLSSILFKKNKWCVKSVVCHQLNLMKDKHNIILILVSTR